MKIVSQLDENGYFVHSVSCDESPLEPGVWLIPGGCVDFPEPESIPENHKAKFVAGNWVFEELPAPPELTYAELRRREYPSMAEYLDGIVKGDQAQIDKYIADCLAVKAKYPKS